MAIDYDFILSDGSHLIPISPYTVPSLESNGPGSQSTPRQILDVSFAPGANTFTIDDSSLYTRTPFTAGNKLDLVGANSPYAGGVYTITTAVPLGNNTIVTVAEPITLSDTTFNITSVTPATKTWQVGVGDGPNLFYPGSTISIQGNNIYSVPTTFTVVSASIPSAGLTDIVVSEVINGSAIGVGYVTPPHPIAYTYASPATPVTGQPQVTLHVVGNIASYLTTPGGTAVSRNNVHSTYEQLTIISAVNNGANTDILVGPVANTSYTIAGVDQTLHQVIVAGDHRAEFFVNNEFVVTFANTPAADKTYTILTSTFDGVNTLLGIDALSLTIGWTSGTITPVTPVFDAGGSFIFPVPALPYGYLQYNTPVGSSLELLGRGASQYRNNVSWGHAMQDNMIHILENFASSLPPAAPLSGQQWYDTSAPALYTFGSTKYTITGGTAAVGGTIVVTGDSTAVTTPGSTIYVYGNAGLNTGTNYVKPYVVSTAVFATPSTTITVQSPGDTTGITTGSLGFLYSKNDFHNILVAGFPAVSNFDMGGHGIVNLKTTAPSSLNNTAEATLGSGAVSQWYADNRLGGLPVVFSTVPAVDNTISWNGSSWVNGSLPINAGPGVNFFYTATPDGTTTGYSQISKVPDPAAEVIESGATTSAGKVLVDAYISAAALGGTQIDPGVWSFNAYAYTDATGATGTNTLLFEVYTSSTPYTAGSLVSPYTLSATETLLFSVTTPSINDTVNTRFTVDSAQPAHALSNIGLNGSTDKLVIKVYAQTTNAATTNLFFTHSGSTHYSYINTPLLLRHNDLPGLQGGTSGEEYHLTALEYAGTGTGVFVKTSSPTISNPTITTGSINNTPIGAVTANTGAFTTLGASSTVTLSPASANVTLSPTGTGTVTINPATAGTINNVSIGTTTASTGRFTTVTSTVATGTAPLTVASTTQVANLNVARAGVADTSTVTTVATAAAFYPTFVSAATGNLALDVSTGLTFNPSTNTLTTTAVSASTLASTVITGTAPLSVASTTQVANLNVARAGVADTVTTTALATAGTFYPTFTSTTAGNLVYSTSTGLTFNPSTNTLTTTAVSASTLASTVITGTAPLTVASTTRVANLNVAQSGSTDALNSATTTIAISTSAAPTAGQLLTATSSTSASWQTPPIRRLLTAAATLYVSTTGLDTNDGLTAGTPFLTIQKAIDTVASYDLSIYDVTIQLADGTYSGAGITVNGPRLGNGNVIVNGNAAAPANVVISTTVNYPISVLNLGTLTVNNVTLTTTTYLAAYAYGNAILTMNNIVFAAAAGEFVRSQSGAIINMNGSSTTHNTFAITSGTGIGLSAQTGIIQAQNADFNFVGTPNFTVAFVSSTYLATIQIFSNLFTGTGATGVRYTATANSVIFTNGGGATYLPGSVAGSVASGGQYL